MTDLRNKRTQPQDRFLVIGYGNELRGDDAVGPRVAEKIAGWQVEGVKAMSVHQLTPELVNKIVDAEYVIFVDACGGYSCARTVQLDPIVLNSSSPKSMAQETHLYNPATLLALTKQLYEYAPQAWLLKIPSESFALGEGLSSTAQCGYSSALRTIEKFLQTYLQPVRLAMQHA